MAIPMEQREWTPPDQLQIKREAGWGYKYFRKADVDRRLDEGWEVCNGNEKKRQETSSMDAGQHYRGLILMRMPIHMVEKRNKHYRDKHLKRLRAAGVGAAMRAKTDEANAGKGEDVFGTIGKGLVLKHGTMTEDGLRHTHTETFNAEDAEKVSKKDMDDLAEVHEAQRKENSGKPENKSGSKSDRGR